MIHVTIYSRPGCHLCDDMKTVVQKVAASWTEPVSIDEINIDTDPDLQARYGVEVPVLMIDGKKVAKYRISEEDVARALAARAGKAGGAGKAGR